MAATNDHIPDFGDFERYHSGEMPPEEQRWLEGKMLAEPLVAEAYEGFLAWRAQHTDLAGVRSALHERLHTRGARRDALPLWAYASAASVVLALLVYWSVFVRDQNAEMQQQAVKPSRISQTEAEKADVSVPPTVQPAETPDDIGHHAVDVLPLGDIGDARDRLSARGLDGSDGFVEFRPRLPRVDGERCAA